MSAERKMFFGSTFCNMITRINVYNGEKNDKVK